MINNIFYKASENIIEKEYVPTDTIINNLNMDLVPKGIVVFFFILFLLSNMFNYLYQYEKISSSDYIEKAINQIESSASKISYWYAIIFYLDQKITVNSDYLLPIISLVVSSMFLSFISHLPGNDQEKLNASLIELVLYWVILCFIIYSNWSSLYLNIIIVILNLIVASYSIMMYIDKELYPVNIIKYNIGLLHLLLISIALYVFYHHRYACIFALSMVFQLVFFLIDKYDSVCPMIYLFPLIISLLSILAIYIDYFPIILVFQFLIVTIYIFLLNSLYEDNFNLKILLFSLFFTLIYLIFIILTTNIKQIIKSIPLLLCFIGLVVVLKINYNKI